MNTEYNFRLANPIGFKSTFYIIVNVIIIFRFNPKARKRNKAFYKGLFFLNMLSQKIKIGIIIIGSCA